jgi:hypothetical protein
MRARAVTLLAAGLLLIGAGRLTADDKADKDQEALQGTWTLETLNQDGKAAPAEDLKRITFVFKDNTYAISKSSRATTRVKSNPAFTNWRAIPSSSAWPFPAGPIGPRNWPPKPTRKRSTRC